MNNHHRLDNSFFRRDVLEVAPELLGKYLFCNNSSERISYIITEVEAYRGAEDLACHASKGLTERNHVMYESGGLIYVYLIYGMYWMLNFLTGQKDDPQAVLIRGIKGYQGPGKLTKHLGIDKTYYGEDLEISDRIWIEDNATVTNYKTSPRIGIDYAGEYWQNKPWRFFL